MTSRSGGTVSLHAARAERVTLAAACERVFSGVSAPIAALIYTPNACRLGVVHRGADAGWQLRDGVASVAVDGDGAFEARLFDGSVDLRWLRDPGAEDGLGTAVLISEDGARAPEGWDTLPPAAGLDVLEGAQLLWGSVLRTTADAVILFTARIGELSLPSSLLPAAVSRNDRITLATREYVAVEAEHGNAYVLDERLVGFRLSAAPGPVEEGGDDE